ncbi:hypothetical protein TNCV_4638391 [Trichonephila clavipes]|uniref:Transposase n=1 Tax=Trichonephila clavipes TaxID=2585209 RepID=A0A8X7BIU3_TRICX|nr:hypothetical protein TNCV_4638391 [Trichonephila clavipes]
MITNFFIPELNNHDVQELWFQQDGATCHTARATIDLLKGTLEDNIRRVIADIRPQKLEKVIENWTSRLDYIRGSRGSPMPKIISKMTATAGSDVVQSGHPIFDDFFQHLWPYIGNNTANVVFQMVKRLWLIRIDQ